MFHCVKGETRRFFHRSNRAIAAASGPQIDSTEETSRLVLTVRAQASGDQLGLLADVLCPAMVCSRGLYPEAVPLAEVVAVASRAQLLRVGVNAYVNATEK